MPNPWMAGLIRDPGRGAGYTVGRNRMELNKQHFTAGGDSYNLVKNGSAGAPSTLAFTLLPKVGVPWQFAEVDALCYDSGNWNDEGPGIEVERLASEQYGPRIDIRPGLQAAEPLTPDQTYWLGEIIRWLESEWGIPAVLYDGPRYGVPAGWRGHVNHGDLDSQRSDGLTREEWAAVTGGGTPPKPRSKTMSYAVAVGIRRDAPADAPPETWAMLGDIPMTQFTGPPNAFGVAEDGQAWAGTEIPIRTVPPGFIDLCSDVARYGQWDRAGGSPPPFDVEVAIAAILADYDALPNSGERAGLEASLRARLT